MKRSFIILSVLLIVILIMPQCGGSGNKTESPDASQIAAPLNEPAVPVIHKYGVKSGIVTFENSGFGLTMKKVLYFDDWGTKEAEETYDSDGILTETNMCDGKNMILLIHKDKAAFNRGGCYRGVAYKFDWEEAQRGGEEYKPTKLSNLTIAGKDCESFSLEISGARTTYAGWNNICFMIETPAGNAKVINKAVSIEENATVPAEKFMVPADYKMN